MLRSEALESVLGTIKDAPCLITVGRAWTEWLALRPSEGNFQMKTLGSGSSLGLGLAMALPHRKIVIIDGDGAVTMNVNGLLTLGRMRPKNLVHLVFDNKIYESSGAIPTATAYNADIAGIAKSAGITSVKRVGTIPEFKSAVEEAFSNDGPHMIVADVQTPGRATSPAYSRLDEVDGKFRFMRYIEQLEGRPIIEDAISVKQSIG
jgi:thiamine pyrophosphate-dependent acetolactate synthase large subunit-like protein